MYMYVYTYIITCIHIYIYIYTHTERKRVMGNMGDGCGHTAKHRRVKRSPVFVKDQFCLLKFESFRTRLDWARRPREKTPGRIHSVDAVRHAAGAVTHQ